MEEFKRNRPATGGADNVAEQVAHQRLVKGFRREEEEYNRSHLLYGDDHIEREEAKPKPSR